jgi:hypothetical protein
MEEEIAEIQKTIQEAINETLQDILKEAIIEASNDAPTQEIRESAFVNIDSSGGSFGFEADSAADLEFGIPAVSLKGKTFTRWVNGYTRKDGTWVNGYSQTFIDKQPVSTIGPDGKQTWKVVDEMPSVNPTFFFQKSFRLVAKSFIPWLEAKLRSKGIEVEIEGGEGFLAELDMEIHNMFLEEREARQYDPETLTRG